MIENLKKKTKRNKQKSVISRKSKSKMKKIRRIIDVKKLSILLASILIVTFSIIGMISACIFGVYSLNLNLFII
jgi:ABC-type microcin C transport system permease subunit YejE